MRKYNNKKTYCLSKHYHDSKFEASYCNRLLAMKQKGEIYHYVTQAVINLCGEGRTRITHIVDFIVYPSKEGTPEVHETKGFFTQVARMKKKMFEQKYPHIPYKVIYQNERRTKCQRQKRKNKLPVYR